MKQWTLISKCVVDVPYKNLTYKRKWFLKIISNQIDSLLYCTLIRCWCPSDPITLTKHMLNNASFPNSLNKPPKLQTFKYSIQFFDLIRLYWFFLHFNEIPVLLKHGLVSLWQGVFTKEMSFKMWLDTHPYFIQNGISMKILKILISYCVSL